MLKVTWFQWLTLMELQKCSWKNLQYFVLTKPSVYISICFQSSVWQKEKSISNSPLLNQTCLKKVENFSFEHIKNFF
jgi:hypothetical protein